MLEVFNKIETSASKIRYIAITLITIRDHYKRRVVLFLTKLADYPIILSLS